MPLANGTKIGPYEIISPLGAGGMGEVYRARDMRLGRDVAIKILPPQVSSDPARKQRFEREAKIISKLNHPHICVLYDIGSQDGVDYLVMECVEGETLAKRLERGPLPLDQVLKFGAQVADALDKAHRNGVVHRDLKPGNIMLTPTGAKLLDFGLAKLPVAQALGTTLSAEATETSPVTQAGTIVGTFQYMSPEQIEGKEVDGRSDIFAFGAVLYEMVTGKRAFQGKSQLSVASAILEKEPEPISIAKPLTPPALDHAIRLCLAKSPEDRWQTARDLALDLKWIAEGGSQAGVPAPVVAHRRSRERIAWALAAVGLLLAAALAYMFARSYLNQPKPNLARFLISPPENVFVYQISPSPDGRFLAFVGVSNNGVRQLWLRPIDNVAAQPMAGTNGVGSFFWSPDSRYLAYRDDTGLKKVAVSGGTPQTLCNLGGISSGSWSPDGEIVFATDAAGPLLKVSADGGEPSPLTTLDKSLAETRHAAPSFLPDGRHFLYLSIRNTVGAQAWICVGSLDSNQTKCLGNTDSIVRYAPPGYLLFERGNTLMAQPFDLRGLATTGDAVPIADSAASFSASDNGILAYTQAEAATQYQLQWFDRNGKTLGTVGQPALYSAPALSPDGTRVAVGVIDAHVGTRDLWLFDLKRATASRFTFDPTDESNPVWSHDGSQIVFTSTQTGNRDIYEKAASGIGNSQLIFASKDQQKSVNDWSPDGRYVVYDTTSPGSLWVLPLFGDRKPFLYVQGSTEAREARFSPNGRYIAYSSNETGNYEVYVATFPDHTGKWQVSAGGGAHPEWRGDGKELFFISGGKLVAVDVSTIGAQFQAGVPKPLFAPDFRPDRGSGNGVYAVTADGQRFLVATTIEQQTIAPVTVVTNWTADLKR
ncbi:MAG: protein kinase domain-containing protein [Candidatus Acidiferrales bacterium]